MLTRRLFLGGAVATSLFPRAARGDVRKEDFSRGFPLGINHLLQLGESRAVGAQTPTLPAKVITLSSFPGMVMFKGGIVTAGAGNLSGFVPLTETLRNRGVNGETGVAAIGQAIIKASGNFSPQQMGWGGDRQLLGSSAGFAGHRVGELLGRAELGRMRDQILFGYLTSTELRVPYTLSGVPFAVGVNDYIHKTSSTVFASVIERYLLGEVIDYYKSVTGDQRIVPIVMPLTCAHRAKGYSEPYLAIAQLQLAEKHTNFMISSPGYQVDFAANGIHESATGYRLRGAYDGVALWWWHVRGEKFSPTQPRQWKLEDGVATIKFSAPFGPVVLDDTWVANPGNFGFVARDARGDLIEIIKTSTVPGDGFSIEVVCSDPPKTIEYAWANGEESCGRLSGPRGCVADSFPLTFELDEDGTSVQLRNYSVPFKLDF